MNEDVYHMSCLELIAEVTKLRTAIRQHRDEKGHNRCWLDDATLYKTLPESQSADFTLPPKCEFLMECNRYWDQRQPPPNQEVS